MVEATGVGVQLQELRAGMLKAVCQAGSSPRARGRRCCPDTPSPARHSHAPRVPGRVAAP